MIAPPRMLVFASRNFEGLVGIAEDPEAVLAIYTHDRLWIVIELIGDVPVLALVIEGKNSIPLLDSLSQLAVPEMRGSSYHNALQGEPHHPPPERPARPLPPTGQTPVHGL